MSAARVLAVFVLLVALPCAAWSAEVILNEYSAVDSNDFLNGGDSAVDEDGGRAYDTYFGRIRGNGGDWFELVVVGDHLDMRGWHLDIGEAGIWDETLDLTGDEIWSDLRSGTIITVAEDVPTDVSYNPAAGDWWINVQANDDAEGLYIEASNFPVSSDDWQLRLRDANDVVIYGPAGEGVSPASGVSGTEIFRLEADPSDAITPESDDYDDGADISTFGAPNQWGRQAFDDLRIVEPAVAAISLIAPNGGEVFVVGETVTIEWTSDGAIEDVLVEFSVDGGASWMNAFPANVGNPGQYAWTVPPVESDQCLIRVSSATQLAVYDTSDAPFMIVPME